MTRGLFGPGTIVLGGGAVVLVAFLAVGFFLPGTWEAEARARLDAPVGDIRPLLDSPEGWRRWTTWPDSALDRSGPERGAGATISWSSSELGTGTFRINGATTSRVTYSVEVEGAGSGPMRTEGTIGIEAREGGTAVHWRETGDLGRNPLMGYWALSMERAQSAEMVKSLERLEEVARGEQDRR